MGAWRGHHSGAPPPAAAAPAAGRRCHSVGVTPWGAASGHGATAWGQGRGVPKRQGGVAQIILQQVAKDYRPAKDALGPPPGLAPPPPPCCATWTRCHMCMQRGTSWRLASAQAAGFARPSRSLPCRRHLPSTPRPQPWGGPGGDVTVLQFNRHGAEGGFLPNSGALAIAGRLCSRSVGPCAAWRVACWAAAAYSSATSNWKAASGRQRRRAAGSGQSGRPPAQSWQALSGGWI